MAKAQQHLTLEWRLKAAPDAVFGILAQPQRLLEWSPAFLPEMLELEQGDEQGIGRILRLQIKGWLPYRLHVHFQITNLIQGEEVGFKIWGDVEGAGRWRVASCAGDSLLRLDLNFSLRKGPIRLFSCLLPLPFHANYAAVIETSAKRIEALVADTDYVGPPPNRSDASPLLLAAGFLAAIVAVRLLAKRRRPK